MKPYNYFPLFLFLLLTYQVQAQNVNIPDANFKAALVNNTAVNTNGDTEIQVTEAQSYTGVLDLFGKSIADLTGIEAFTALTGLSCRQNQLSSLDVSNNTALTFLVCTNNQLTTLNLSNNTNLINLICDGNSLSSLDLTNNAVLEYLLCQGNQLTSITFALNTALTEINCSNNLLTSLDVSNNTVLTDLRCDDNTISSFTFSPSLIFFYCKNNQLTSLDLNGLPNLIYLDCDNNQLSNLDLSVVPTLGVLYCQTNSLNSLDLSNNLSLARLYCGGNSLSNLDVSGNPVLTNLSCRFNQLVTLNVQNGYNTNFFEFDALNNPNLSCIQVDSVAYSNLYWNDVDFGVVFSTNCFTGTSTLSSAISPQAIEVFPNPTSGYLTLNFNTFYTNPFIKITDMAGQVVFSKMFPSSNQLDLNLDLPKGAYILNISTSDKTSSSILKFI